MITVFGRASSINVRKVLWCCDELALSIQREDWGKGFQSPRTPAFLELNPNGQVPVIRDGDFVLWESNAILRYLANRYSSDSCYPSEARQRALVDQWMDWQATSLNNAGDYAFMALIRNSPDHTQSSELAVSVANWNAHIGILNRHLATTGAYVAGAHFTIADISIGMAVNRWLSTPLGHPDYFHVNAYFKRLSERTGFFSHCNNGIP